MAKRVDDPERFSVRLRRERARKRLNGLLAKAPVEGVFQLLWDVDALQSGRADRVRAMSGFPREAITSDLTSRWHMHKWELETLANEAITVSRRVPTGRGPSRVLNCRTFNTVVALVNSLRGLEDAESGIVGGTLAYLLYRWRRASR